MISNNDRKILEEARHRFSSKINLFTNARNKMFPSKNPPNSIYLCEKPNVFNNLVYQYHEEEVKKYLKKRGFNFSLLNKKLSLLKCGEVFYEVLLLSPRNFFQDIKFCAEAVDVFPPIICKYIDNISDDLPMSVIEDAVERFPCFINIITKKFSLTNKFTTQLIKDRKYLFDTQLLKQQILFNVYDVLEDLDDFEEMLPVSCQTYQREGSYKISRHLIDVLEINIADLTPDHAECFDIDIFSIEELGLWNDISTETFVNLLFDAALINDKREDISQVFDYIYINRDSIKNADVFLEAFMIVIDLDQFVNNRYFSYSSYYELPWFIRESKYLPYLVYEYFLRGEKKYIDFYAKHMGEMIDQMNPFKRIDMENKAKSDQKIKGPPSFKRKELKRIATRNINRIIKHHSFLYGYRMEREFVKTTLKQKKYHYYCQKLVGYAKEH